ncbi:hematopoietic progenitor cell antigen CD34 [Ambystoma mexicanum]|uniref:hematopoietic progenitor cell antigen CD34 n=1 Tax=Ambystoma mexicanum TaxID=8296 RepID=UPI0037E74E98
MKRTELLWALFFIANFAGTFQEDPTPSPAPSSSLATTTATNAPAETTTKATTAGITTATTIDAAPTAQNSTKPSPTVAVEPAAVTNVKSTVTTGATSPSVTLPPGGGNFTTTSAGVDKTHHSQNETTTEESGTTYQTNSTSRVPQPAATRPYTSSSDAPTAAMKVIVNCLEEVHNPEEMGACEFNEKVTCDELKTTKIRLAEKLCKENYQENPSITCVLMVSTSALYPRCLNIHDERGKKLDLNPRTLTESKENAQHDSQAGEEKTLTTQASTKPKTTLIALITTGLVVAALILCGYFLSNRQSWSPGSQRLDEDYAGNDSPDNTLISVATRDQSGQSDRPTLKGGTQENGTGQAVTGAATNGHSNKQHVVADTEL